jgi:hypothetical protein
MSLKATLAPLLLSCLVAGAPQHQSQSVACRTEYSQVWDTQYQEKETQECVTNYEKVCQTVTERLCQPTTRQECHTRYEASCSTVYKSVCVQQYKTEYEPYTETDCTTQYKEDCEYQWEGNGNNKVWAKIPGTCKQNPYDKCQDVTKTKEKQVAYPVCNDVPEQKCVDVPRQHCRQVPDQVCTNQPLQKCDNVPRQHCTTKHKKVPVRISKSIPKKVCDTAGSDYGYSANTPNTPQPANPEVVLDIGRANPITNLLKNNKIVFADK